MSDDQQDPTIDMSAFAKYSSVPMPKEVKDNYPLINEWYEGILPNIGVQFVATKDAFGQIDVSLSGVSSERPTDYLVMHAFVLFGITPRREIGKKTGKIRHFLVQYPYIQ